MEMLVCTPEERGRGGGEGFQWVNLFSGVVTFRDRTAFEAGKGRVFAVAMVGVMLPPHGAVAGSLYD